MKKLLLVLNLLFFTATVVVAEIYPSAYTQEQRELHGYMQKQRQLKKQCTENPYANRLYFRASIKAIVEFRRIQTDIQDVAEDIELNNILPEAKSTLGTLEKQLRKDVRALNNQIEENARLIAEGRAGATTYIVDLRKANKQPAFLDEPKIAEVNTKLQQINQATGSTKVAFYVLLNMYYPDSNVSINGESREDYLKRYITELYQRSKLTTNGILLNIESFIRLGDIRTANSGTGSITTVPSKFLLSYHPYVALGRDLKETSIDELIKTNIVNIGSRPGFEFAVQGAGTSANKPHRGEVLDKYVSAIDDVLKGKTADFFASETGSEYFAELKLPADQRQQMIAKFTTANTSPKVTDRLKDYAGVEIFLQRLFGNYYSQLSTNLTDKLNLSIITTSDKNTSNGVNAIQLVKQIQPSDNNLVIGIHFLEPETTSGNIRVRFALSYGGNYGDLVKNELHNVWNDIRLLDYSDQVQSASQSVFRKFNEVLDVINECISKIRIPESWWNTNSIIAMDPFLAGVINAILDDVVGIIQLAGMALKVSVGIQYYVLQAALYGYELYSNPQKRAQVKAEIDAIIENWFPVLKGALINTVTFFGTLEGDLKDQFFQSIPQEDKVRYIENLYKATTVKDLAINASPFFLVLPSDISRIFQKQIGTLIAAGWEKITNATGKEIEYYTGYIAVQIVGCFFGVTEAMALIKGTTTAAQIASQAADAIKAVKSVVLKTGDDLVAFLRNVFTKIKNGIDEESFKKFLKKLGKNPFGNYKNVDNWLKGISNTNSRTTIEGILTKWNHATLEALDARLTQYPNLASEFLSNNQLLHYFNGLETTWWARYALGGLSKRSGNNFPTSFKSMIDDIEITSLGAKLRLRTVSIDIASPQYIGKLFDEAMEVRMRDAWRTNRFDDFPEQVATELQRLKDEGYEMVIEAELSIAGKNPVPDYLFVKKEIDELTNVITYDINDIRYVDCKYLWDSPFTSSQTEIVNGVATNGRAIVSAKKGLTDLNGTKFIPDNTTITITTVEKLTVDQQLDLIIQ